MKQGSHFFLNEWITGLLKTKDIKNCFIDYKTDYIGFISISTDIQIYDIGFDIGHKKVVSCSSCNSCKTDICSHL